MGKGLVRSLSRGEPLLQPVIKYRVPIDFDAPFTTTKRWATAVLGALPEGDLLFLGATLHLNLDASGHSGIDDAWEGDIALGENATNNDTISGGEHNMLGTLAIPAATSKVATFSGSHNVATTGIIVGNTNGNKSVHLNILVDSADITGDTIVRVTGFLVLAIIIMGDD